MPTETSVIARFAELDEARQAFEGLQRHGVDAADIRVRDSRVTREVRAKAQDAAGREDLDQRTTRAVGRRVVQGAVAGALVGLLLGAALGAVMVAVVEGISNPVLVGIAIACLTPIGAVVGAFASVESRVGYNDTWQLALDDEAAGPVWVAVRASDRDQADRAADALSDLGAAEVEVREAEAEGPHSVRW